MNRHNPPPWCDTPAEATYWADTIDRTQDEAADHRNNAADTHGASHYNCGNCDHAHCLICACRRVFGSDAA